MNRTYFTVVLNGSGKRKHVVSRVNRETGMYLQVSVHQHEAFQFLNAQEAALCAKVNRGTLYEWAARECEFEEVEKAA